MRHNVLVIAIKNPQAAIGLIGARFHSARRSRILWDTVEVSEDHALRFVASGGLKEVRGMVQDCIEPMPVVVIENA